MEVILLVVWKSDRVSRPLKQLKNIMNLLKEKGMNSKDLQKSIETGSSGGYLIFHLFNPLAEFEREMICDRTIAGVTAAKERGRVGGCPRKR